MKDDASTAADALFGGYNRRDLRMFVGFFRMLLRDKVLGSSLGMIWAVANPLLMLGIFTFVFGFVFKSRLPGAESSLGFVIWLVSGYGPWLAISEGLNACTAAVVGNAMPTSRMNTFAAARIIPRPMTKANCNNR